MIQSGCGHNGMRRSRGAVGCLGVGQGGEDGPEGCRIVAKAASTAGGTRIASRSRGAAAGGMIGVWKLKDTIGGRSESIEPRSEQVVEAQHGRQIGTGPVVITSRPQARPIAPEAKSHPIVAVVCASSDADTRMQRREEKQMMMMMKKKRK